jgi:DNA primase small subunit
MVRHKSFRDYLALRDFIQGTTPSDVYYSTAYYQRPEYEMEKKGWRGADLCFDIDADHLRTPCKQSHDSWKCVQCGTAGFGNPPESCPACYAKRFETNNWFCKDCLKASKQETLKLLAVLQEDFGFQTSDLDVCFSGHRGFHVHIEDKRVIGLDQSARKEIVDYVMSTGIDLKYYGFPRNSESGNIKTRFDFNEPGWRGRAARNIHDFLLNLKEEDLKGQGFDVSMENVLLNNKEEIANVLAKKAKLKTYKGLNIRGWERIVYLALKTRGIEIDTVVTVDIHRLIRLPYTLHRKTGFMVVVIPVDELSDFDPFADAIAFKEGIMKLHVSASQKFEVAGYEYGPYKDEDVELPTASAMFLLCKGLAEPL